MALTIAALLSTAVVASFRVGISSWRLGEDFLDRSQRLSAAGGLIQKQIGSTCPLISLNLSNVPTNFNQPLPSGPQETPAFVGDSRELIFVSDYPLAGQLQGGLQLIRYFVIVPEASSDPGIRSNAVSGMELRITSTPIFRREDYPQLLQSLKRADVTSVKLLGDIQDITFQYWAEEEPDPAAGVQLGRPRIVSYSEWNGGKHQKLPEAVSLQVHFVSGSALDRRHPYNQDSFSLFVPINVSKSG